MYRKRFVIIGAGFAGLSAAKFLSEHKRYAEVVVVDKRENCVFRPLIPDVVSGRIHSKNLLYPILAFKEKYGFIFYNDLVNEIEFDRNEIILSDKTLGYDYLILATGSQTSIPPSGPFRQFALRLESVYDANHIRSALTSGLYERFVICGGGYTGVEIASNLQQIIRCCGLSMDIVIVEMVERVLSSLPHWMSNYVTKTLADLGVQIRLSTKVDTISDDEVLLSNGEHFKKTFCIWTAGLEASTLSRKIDVSKAQKGRIIVDRNLFFKENCLAAGDAACCKTEEGCSRMSVQNSIDQGRIAASNALAHMRNKPLKKYVIWDPGFIIPMTRGKACGEIFNIPVKDRIALVAHYLLSLYRTNGIINRLNVASAALRAF